MKDALGGLDKRLELRIKCDVKSLTSYLHPLIFLIL